MFSLHVHRLNDSRLASVFASEKNVTQFASKILYASKNPSYAKLLHFDTTYLQSIDILQIKYKLRYTEQEAHSIQTQGKHHVLATIQEIDQLPANNIVPFIDELVLLCKQGNLHVQHACFKLLLKALQHDTKLHTNIVPKYIALLQSSTNTAANAYAVEMYAFCNAAQQKQICTALFNQGRESFDILATILKMRMQLQM